jgi:hypothetical protein
MWTRKLFYERGCSFSPGGGVERSYNCSSVMFLSCKKNSGPLFII